MNKLIIITGHYGSGKTSVGVNLALKFLSENKKVKLVDMDIVNPYFRSADFKEILEEKGIEVLTPMYARSNLDVPALTPAVDAAIEDKDCTVILDVGGDDDGAVALGRYREGILKRGYELWYVVNRSRYFSDETEDEVHMAKNIEHVSGLEITGIINNTNMGKETDAELIKKSFAFADDTAKFLGAPIVFTSVKSGIDLNIENRLEMNLFTNPIWENNDTEVL